MRHIIRNAVRWLYYSMPRALHPTWVFPCRNVVVEVTYRCNLRCRMCYILHEKETVSAHPGKTRTELCKEDLVSIIDAIPRGGCITFTGGEVFVKPWMIDIIEYAAARVYVTIATNAVLLDEEKCRRIVAAGVRAVGVSLDGSSRVHDETRGVPGAFDKAQHGIASLVQARRGHCTAFPRININAVIMDENVQFLDQIVDIARDWGVDSCTFQVYDASIHRSGLYAGDTILCDEDVIRDVPSIDSVKLETGLYAMLEQARTVDMPVHFAPSLTVEELTAYYKRQFDLRQWRCDQPWTTLRVSPYGDVFPCLNFAIGNIHDAGIQQLWNAARFKQFRCLLNKKGIFAACAGCCKMIRKI